MAESEIHYGCPGCGSEVTENQFLAGQTTCSDTTCDSYGQPLERLSYCAACDEYYSEELADEHSMCG
jgi:hypothetical protein